MVQCLFKSQDHLQNFDAALFLPQLSEELRSLNGDSDDWEVFNVTAAPVIAHLSQNQQDTAVRQLLGSRSVDTKKVGTKLCSLAVDSVWYLSVCHLPLLG